MRIGVLCSALLALCLFQVPKRANAASSSPTPEVVAQPSPPQVPEGPPPGFHEERRPVYALIVTGAVITGVGVLCLGLAASVASNAQHETQEDRDNAMGYVDLYKGVGVAHLVVGVPLLMIGVFYRHRVNVPDQAMMFVPILSANRVGGAFSLSF
jgi:hypothetical protein